MCPKCKSTEGYKGHIKEHRHCFVDDGGDWEESFDDCYHSDIFGPFWCKKCGAEFDEIPENE